ncbi:TNT domain-containing protein [Clostridium lacusfryxellense]|uniref:TNT domain-containing protein n=1 Tax=Clostridium lacusfryxellense TaxID=205328 RepID=UPI001C0B07D4|nr:TNT domain-containing protein [Clostridium lacusfryxellense]MBU3112346.1 TNT domain-containing protein [Clostridium lacusfryxellense]
MKRLKTQRGSASIEATVSLTAFIFVIMAIYAIVNFCIVQAKMATAINSTAKEISQYSYMYHALGVQELDTKVTEGKKQALDAYDAISALIENPDVEAKAGTGDGTGDLAKVIDDKKIPVDGELAKMQEAQSAISGAVKDPAAFVKSIGALGASVVIDKVKSHLIAAPIAKGLSQRHFGETSAEANTYLENLGVVGGYDGVNFDMSTMLVSGNPQDIQIIVYYNIGMSSIFPVDLKITMCQRASARAWLGGDLEPKNVVVEADKPQNEAVEVVKPGDEAVKIGTEVDKLGIMLKSASGLSEALSLISKVDFAGVEDVKIKTLFSTIDESSMSKSDKVTEKATLFRKILSQGAKSNAMVVADSTYIDVITGDIKWPSNPPGGFAINNPPSKSLMVGTIIDRYGDPLGSYMSPVGTPYGERALPYIENPNAYHKYRVIKQIDNVKYGKIASVFNQPGGGIQYKLPDIVDNLLKTDNKYLEEIFN